MEQSDSMQTFIHLLVVITAATIFAAVLVQLSQPASGASTWFGRATKTWQWAVSNAYGTASPNPGQPTAKQATTGTGSVVG